MDERVDDSNEGSMATRIVLGSTPRYHRHDGVMVEVKEGDLAFFLPDHEENCVKKLRYLCKEVDVDTSGYLQRKVQ